MHSETMVPDKRADQSLAGFFSLLKWKFIDIPPKRGHGRITHLDVALLFTHEPFPAPVCGQVLPENFGEKSQVQGDRA